MLIGLGVLVGLVAALPLGARLEGLGSIKWRLAPLCFAGFVLQIVLFSDNPLIRGPLLPHAAALHILSVACVLASLSANWRLPGLPIIILGSALNFAAITANGGHMPRAMAPEAKPFTNVAVMSESTALTVLGDWIDVPVAPGKLFSIGDFFIAGGGGAAAFCLARRREQTALAPTALPA